jgi:hypothetical protein
VNYFGYKRDLQKSFRDYIYAWMSSGKNVASLVSRILPIRKYRRESPLVKTRRAKEDNAFTDPRRKRQPKFLWWSAELLLAVGFNIAKRYVKSWTASLAREEIPLRKRVSEPRISGKIKSETIIVPPQRRQEVERGQTRTRKSYAARVLDLLMSAAKEWSRDKSPQLGAALAYYTVFSLAPLVLVLLGVFGLIYGGSEQAR